MKGGSAPPEARALLSLYGEGSGYPACSGCRCICMMKGGFDPPVSLGRRTCKHLRQPNCRASHVPLTNQQVCSGCLCVVDNTMKFGPASLLAPSAARASPCDSQASHFSCAAQVLHLNRGPPDMVRASSRLHDEGWCLYAESLGMLHLSALLSACMSSVL